MSAVQSNNTKKRAIQAKAKNGRMDRRRNFNIILTIFVGTSTISTQRKGRTKGILQASWSCLPMNIFSNETPKNFSTGWLVSWLVGWLVYSPCSATPAMDLRTNGPLNAAGVRQEAPTLELSKPGPCMLPLRPASPPLPNLRPRLLPLLLPPSKARKQALYTAATGFLIAPAGCGAEKKGGVGGRSVVRI